MLQIVLSDVFAWWVYGTMSWRHSSLTISSSPDQYLNQTLGLTLLTPGLVLGSVGMTFFDSLETLFKCSLSTLWIDCYETA